MLRNWNKTEIGSTLFVDTKMKRIEEFVAFEDTSYDVRLENYELSIITGKNDLERNLPILRMPIIVDKTVVLDLRENVRVKPGFTDLDEILNMRSDYMLKFYMLKLIDIAKDGLDDYRDTYIKLAQISYTNVLANALILDQDDKRILNGLIALLATTVFDAEKDLDTRILIAQNNTIGDRLSDGDYEHLLNGVDDLVRPSDLIEILHTTNMVGKRLAKLDTAKLYSTISAIVFKSHNINAMVGLEYPPALLSLMFLYGTNTLYKKTLFAFGVNNFSKLLKIDDKLKALDRDIKEMLPFG